MADKMNEETQKQGTESRAEEDNVVSMLDILEEEKQLEEDANAVLGASDARNCTYPRGYLERQALYSCVTCNAPGGEPAGVCLACSLECHDGHELFELYTKRNFQCDCGNSKFGDFACKLYPTKGSKNEDNKYNHNFEGKYCVCNRPYPDPEDDIEDEMIQCVICEDWYHGRHLGAAVPESGDYEELTCAGCLETCSFLRAYAPLYAAKPVTSASDSGLPVSRSEEEANIDVSSTEASLVSASTSASCASDATTASEAEEYVPSRKELKRAGDDTQSSEASPSKKPRTRQVDETSSGGDGDCKLRSLRASYSEEDLTSTGGVFWKTGWRTKLCSCTDCINMYCEAGVRYLSDEADTITAYEARGKQARQQAGGSQYEQGMQALSGMDRLQQVEMLQGYNDMKGALTEYLKSFADSGKVVTPADIQAFFATLASRKNDTSTSMQYFCK